MLILIILLVLLVAGTGPWYPYSTNWGYGPFSLLGLILIIALLFLLLGGRTRL